MRSIPLRFRMECLWNILFKKCGISNQPVTASAMIRVFPSLEHSRSVQTWKRHGMRCQPRHGRNTQILLQRSALADTFETLCPLISYPVTHANQRLVWQRFSISYSFSIQRSSCASRSSYLQSPCLRQSHFPQFSIKKSMFIAARACLHISRYV